VSTLRGTSVLIAGAGLAGLTAARDLSKKGADVTVIEARTRVGGRVLTRREPFLQRQHVEAGADLINEDQNEIRTLVGDGKPQTFVAGRKKLHNKRIDIAV